MIDIFNIYDPHNIKCILYQKTGIKNIIKISDDSEQVVFSNQEEHFILKGKSQDFFPQIGLKTIRNCLYFNKKFYFVNSEEYDRDCEILCSDSIGFNTAINRFLEPG